MSHEDSLDDETKRILAEVDTDDSKESVKPKKDVKQDKDTEYDISDDKELDDKEW